MNTKQHAIRAMAQSLQALEARLSKMRPGAEVARRFLELSKEICHEHN